MSIRLSLTLLVGLAIFCQTPVQAADTTGTTSKLWGEEGERWDPTGRLPDFSYAGYHRGEHPWPEKPVETSVKDFGAVGDGRTDDSDAFLRAIAASSGKVLSIPPGQYVIKKILTIASSGTVLRGAGSDKTVLICPVPLNDLKPNWGATTTGEKTSNYSWSGGIVEVTGRFPSSPLAQVEVAAKRGDRTLTVNDPKKLKVGQDYVLRLDDDETTKSLIHHLYAGDPGRIENLSRVRETFAFRITAIDAAKKVITIDRPLRTDVRLEWRPIVLDGRSNVEEVGIEHLAFSFPNTPYRGHFTEVGFNAITVQGARNCWLSNLRIHNADSGVFVGGSNNTVRGVRITSKRPPEKSRQATGHHGITLNGQDNLLTDFEYETRFMHDVTLTRGSAGNVISRGSGVDLCFDHHCYAPHSNLFVELKLGSGSRMFQSGGGAGLGRHCAAYETFWNISADKPQSWPREFAPDLIQLIGVATRDPSATSPVGRWFEAIPPAKLRPVNLYEAQLKKRLQGG